MDVSVNIVNSIPKHIQELLNKIAKQNGYKSHKVHVTGELGKGENYMAYINCLTLEGVKENGDVENIKLILKTAPSNLVEHGVPIDLYYACEEMVYKKYIPLLLEMQTEAKIPEDLRIQFPKCFAATSEKGRGALILEDLNAKGYAMYDRMKSLDKDHAFIFVKKLATFHALGFAAKERLSQGEYEKIIKMNAGKAEATQELFNFIHKVCLKSLDLVDSVENKNKMKEIIKIDWTKLVFDLLDFNKSYKESNYNIIVHTDCWSNNVLFRYENGIVKDMMFVDFQTIKFATPIADLAIFGYICLDEETRDRYWNELTETYYDVLCSRLRDLDCNPEKCYPDSVFRAQLKIKMKYGMYACFLLLPLVMTRKEDSFGVNDMIEEDTSEFNFNAVKFSDEYKKRFNGVLRHLIKTDVF